MKGISGESILSLGSVKTNILFANHSIEHKFHVVSDDFQIPTHGILGKDFIKFHKCLIDYGEMQITIRPKNAPQFSIPLFSELMRGISALPPCSESFKNFHIQSKSFPCVVEAQEIDKNVFVPTTVVHTKEAWLRVLNTNDTVKLINTERVKTKSVSDFNIFKCNGSNETGSNRISDLKRVLDRKIPNHVKKTLMDLCIDFSDVFHLENDRCTVNNFYSQSLTLTNDQPVYTKNYRLPQTQKAEIRNQVAQLLENDLIEMSTSAYNSPLIIVPKKSTDGNKKWRMCVDYRL